ncbi:protogenin-like isoform X1 [Panulirus ornatus]|uniref:protogenin-like isoform X1 n=1 Tax=Panulirus ornatus TaxID=150431 RepID=UPI003A83F079
MAQLWVLGLVGLVTLCYLPPGVRTHHFLNDSFSRLGFGFQDLPPMESVTVIGAELLLPCQPIKTETGVPNVTWTNEGQVVNDPRRYVLANGTLLISNVTASDAGLYRCVLHRGPYAVVSAALNLITADTGAWQMQPRNTTVREGSAVRLTCLFSSIPPAILTWLKDEEPLPLNDRYYQPKPGVLQITNITVQDASVYRCTAINPLLRKQFLSPGGYLSVVALSDSPAEGGDDAEVELPPRPSLLAVPSKVEVEVGHRGVLECMTDDIYHPQLLWSRIDERPIRTKGVNKEGQGSLVFLEVQEQDAAVYNCSIVSRHHRVPVTQMIELSVLKAPKAEVSMSTRKSMVPVFNPVRNGASVVRITCATEGVPTPEISWYKDGLPIPVSGRHHFVTLVMEKNFTKQELAIANIMGRDSGVYQCVVRNRVGVASEGFKLTVNLLPNMPEAPVDILVKETSTKDILVAWSPSPSVEKAEVMGYIVHYFEVGPVEKEKQHLTNNTSFKIEKLRPYTNYSIYIRTFVIFPDEVDPVIGEPSEPLFWRTRADVPGRLPKVTLRALSPTVLLVTWKHLSLEEAKGAITKQKIQWQKKDSHFYVSKDLVPNVTEYEIQDLLPNKWYRARVLVRTEAGYPHHYMQLPWDQIKMPKVGPRAGHDNNRIQVHLSVFSENPTDILVDWVLADVLRPNVLTYEVTYNSTPEVIKRKNTEASASSVVLKNLEPGTCYTVKVEPFYKDVQERGRRATLGCTICTLAVPPDTLPQHKFTDKIGIKKIRVKVLNTTSMLVSWRPKGKRMTPDFFTVKVVSLGLQKSAKASLIQTQDPDVEDAGGQGIVEQYFGTQGIGGRDMSGQETTREAGGRSCPTDGLAEESQDTKLQESQEPCYQDWSNDRPVRYMRLTRKRLILTDLEPLHGYEVTVTPSTATLTGASSAPHQAITEEGVPSVPVNVSWSAASPKDAILTWSRPRHINGQLLHYLVTYSHDQIEWKNQTVDHHLTSTQIQDLVSNTNYTLQIAGVTGGGMGTHSTVFIYIRATLVGEPQISTELVVISVVSLLAAVTCIVVVLLCLRIIRLRQNSAAAFQGNGTCRMVYANGVKASGRDHGTELNDYKPMLASLPPTTHNHHLDTKGGPGSHDDGIVANCLLDPSAVHMNQADVPNDIVEPLCDGIGPHKVEDSLDEIDDDASSRLLQKVSTAESAFSSLKDFDPRSIRESTQVDPNSLNNGSGVALAIVS